MNSRPIDNEYVLECSVSVSVTTCVSAVMAQPVLQSVHLMWLLRALRSQFPSSRQREEEQEDSKAWAHTCHLREEWQKKPFWAYRRNPPCRWNERCFVDLGNECFFFFTVFTCHLISKRNHLTVVLFFLLGVLRVLHFFIQLYKTYTV